MHERRRRDTTGKERDFSPLLHESVPQMTGYDTAKSSPLTLEALSAELNRIKSVHGVWMKQKDEELHELQRKVEMQERELMQKSAELRFAGRGLARQENRRLNGVDGPERKNFWPPSFDCVVLVVVIIFTILQFSMPATPPPPQHMPQVPIGGSSASYSYKLSTAVPKKRIKPSESRPPKPIELLDTTDPAILMRHKCLAAIRTRHADFYKAVFPKGQILLVDPAYHSNVGDHMLTLGEREFIKRMGLKAPLECDYVQAGGFVPLCSEFLWRKTPVEVTVAMWHAGGNWGDVWRTAQEARVASFRKLLLQNLTIISMPQSYHYKSTYLEIADADKIRSGVFEGVGTDISSANLSAVQQKVTFTWRENESAERAKKLYPFVNNVIVPDIAFQLGPYAALPPKKSLKVDLLIFLRKDHESNVGYLRGASFIDEILRKVGKTGVTYKVVDWPDRLMLFKSDDIFFTDTAIQLLSLGRVVICDRLHAAILAYLSGLPFVFTDQATGKITKTLRVAFESSEECKNGEKARWAKGTTLEQSIKKAIDFLDHYKLRSDNSALSITNFFKAN